MSPPLNFAALAEQFSGGDERIRLIAQLLESQQKESTDDEEEHERARKERAVRFLRKLNSELSAAAGACLCWGKRPSCSTCHGKGQAGWRSPDEALFFSYFGPLLTQLGLLRERSSNGSR